MNIMERIEQVNEQIAVGVSNMANMAEYTRNLEIHIEQLTECIKLQAQLIAHKDEHIGDLKASLNQAFELIDRAIEVAKEQ